MNQIILKDRKAAIQEHCQPQCKRLYEVFKVILFPSHSFRLFLRIHSRRCQIALLCTTDRFTGEVVPFFLFLDTRPYCSPANSSNAVTQPPTSQEWPRCPLLTLVVEPYYQLGIQLFSPLRKFSDVVACLHYSRQFACINKFTTCIYKGDQQIMYTQFILLLRFSNIHAHIISDLL